MQDTIFNIRFTLHEIRKMNLPPYKGVQNKPNSRKAKMDVSLAITRNYNSEPRTMNNELLFKTNPIKPNFKPVPLLLCGNRYQEVTRIKGKKRVDGSRVKTYYYGCAGYITKGTKVCDMNPIPKKILEEKAIEVVLDFYNGYLDKGGRKRLAEAVELQVNCEGKELVTARRRAQAKQEKIDKTIDNLLDNITATNREYIDQRLNELKQQKQQLETRLEELDQLYLSQAEIDGIVTDSMQFLSGIEFTLHHGLPQEKLVALRQCIEKIGINKPAGEIKLAIRIVPAGNLQATQEFRAPFRTISIDF